MTWWSRAEDCEIAIGLKLLHCSCCWPALGPGTKAPVEWLHKKDNGKKNWQHPGICYEDPTKVYCALRVEYNFNGRHNKQCACTPNITGIWPHCWQRFPGQGCGTVTVSVAMWTHHKAIKIRCRKCVPGMRRSQSSRRRAAGTAQAHQGTGTGDPCQPGVKGALLQKTCNYTSVHHFPHIPLMPWN